MMMVTRIVITMTMLMTMTMMMMMRRRRTRGQEDKRTPKVFIVVFCVFLRG